MLVEEVVGQRNVLLIPAFPIADLISGDQHDRHSLWIEREQNAQLGPARRAGPELFHILMPGPGYAVDDRSTELGPLFRQQLDRGDHLLTRTVIQ